MKPEQLAEMRKLIESQPKSWWDNLVQDYEEKLKQQAKDDASQERREHPGLAAASFDDWEPPKDFDREVEWLRKALQDHLEKALDAWYESMGKVVEAQYRKARFLSQVVELDQLKEDVLMECLEKMLGLSQRHYE
jgi:membrane protein required for beta-lactamase induction